MAKKDPKSPATTSNAWDMMMPKWAKIDALLGGTESMRDAGEAFMPKHPEESARAHQQRIDTCVLLNMVDMTLTSLVSRPFGEPIKIGADVPEVISSLLPNIDLQGTSFDRFNRNWFKEGIAKGFSGCLVEFPRPDPTLDGSPRTAADDQKDKLRPYLVRVSPENIIAARAVVVNGQEILTEVRIREEIIEADEYAEVLKERIRVLTPGAGEVFEKKKLPSGKTSWVSIDTYTYDLPFIPMEIYYADRQAFMLSKPPLLDLANLNIRHWQSTSDQIAVLTVARFPMLAVSGVAETGDITIGPNNLLSVTDPTGRFYYVEHTGKAIAAGRQDLQDLEEVMAEYGATFLKKRPGGATATARTLDSVEVTSALQDMSLGFQDSLNRVMRIFGQWLKITEVGTYELKRDFGLSDKAEAGLQALKDARVNHDICRKEYILGLIRYGVLSENFPLDENETLVNQEIQDQLKIDLELAAQAQAKGTIP